MAIKPILIGIGVSVLIFVIGSWLASKVTGFGGLFVMPVFLLIISIVLIGSIVGSILLKAHKISDNGANPKTIRNIILVGLLMFVLIVIKTFWAEIFR